MEPLHDFFIASVSAAGALIGLLFVAISIAPEKIFGEAADPVRRADATGAFTSLVNIFFVSLGALVPKHGAPIVFAVAVLGMVQILVESARLGRQYPELRGRHRFGTISLCIFAVEAVFAARVWQGHETADGIVYTVLGIYAYALGTAWTLLGGRHWRPRS